MTAASIPSAERSGTHRIAHAEVGDVREVIATIAGFATMARAQTVGPRALRDLLPELWSATECAEPAVMRAVVGSCEVLGLSTGAVSEAGSAAERLLEATRDATRPLRAAVEAAMASSPPRTQRAALGARTRIALQNACQQTVEALVEVRAATELLLRASTCEPLAVGLEDLLSELVLSDTNNGREVSLEGALDPTVAVAVAPKVAVPMLHRVLSRLVQPTDGEQGVLRFELSSRAAPGSVTLVLTRSTSASTRGSTRPRRALRLRVPPPRPFDPPVVTLAAGALAAKVSLQASGAQITFLAAGDRDGP